MDDFEVRQREAREKQKQVNASRQQKLLPVALALTDPKRAPEIVRMAMKQVNLWREKKLCSADYIEAWEVLLKRPEEAAEVLRDPSLNAIQLRQNSPFVGVVRHMQDFLHAS